MKTVGMLGGMSWESTLGYYRAINEEVKKVLGGLHSAKIALYSVDFDPIEEQMRNEQWQAIVDTLVPSVKNIERAGADFLIICTNTMHKLAPQIEKAISIPVLHIADATAEALVKNKINKVGLLGTAITMREDFYKDRITDNFGIDVLVPNADDQQVVHDIIFKELCLGKTGLNSKCEFLRIINALVDKGAEAIILGCTEIGMLINQTDTKIPLYDTVAIHAEKAVAFALEGE